MKNLKNYIIERGPAPIRLNSDEKIIAKLEELAIDAIGYLNKEGGNEWSEKNLKDYVNGSKEPNYIDVVEILIGNCGQYPDILKVLKEYPKTNLKEDIELATLNAMKKYVER